MDLFNLAAKLTLDSSQFEKGVSDANKQGQGLASSFSGVFGKIKKFAAGALSLAALKKTVGAVVELANATADYGDRIDKQSQVLGLSRKAYQEWDYILGQNGASIDSLGVSMKTLNAAIQSATEGNEEYNGALVKLGLNYVELNQMSPEDRFEAVVRAFQKMPEGAKKSALAIEMFGRNGMELLPLLNQSETSIDELRQRAEELGLIMSDDAVDAAVVYGDSLDDLHRTFDAFKYAIGAKILPVLTKGIQGITNYAGKLKRAYDEKGFAGVWETLVADFKAIKWPTWDEVKTAVVNGWNSIVNGVKGLAKLVFGENVDGSIDWPTWEEVGEAIGNAWNGIKEGVANLGTTIGKIIFGGDGNVSTEIKWPTWDEIKEGVTTAWKGIVDAVSQLGEGFGRVVFGENVDGTIDWPTWDEISESVSSAWQGIVDGVKSLGTTIGKAVFGENVDGSIKFPTWDDVQSTIESAWQGIIDGVGTLAKIAPALIDASEMTSKISSWWNEEIVPQLGGILNYTLGLFGLPSVEEMANAIKTWWENVKKSVGSLFMNAGVNIVQGWNSLFGGGGGQGGGDQGFNPHVSESPGFAKGLNFVPYDNFVANLHRGEKILSASQARQYREGGNGSLDIGGLSSAIEAAIKAGMEGATVKSYLNGKDISNDVNRRQMRAIKARRYAT